MTQEQLAHEIAVGLVKTGIEGGFDAVSCSTAGDYPSIGLSQWEGSRADKLLDMIPGGDRFSDCSFSRLSRNGLIPALKFLLNSAEGQAAQLRLLEEDCGEYVDILWTVPDLDDSRCTIYAGMWCPTSHYVVSRFLKKRQERGYNLRSLKAMRDMFRDEYAEAASIPSNCYDGYANRAETTFQYVAGIDLTTQYGEPWYGQTANGR